MTLTAERQVMADAEARDRRARGGAGAGARARGGRRRRMTPRTASSRTTTPMLQRCGADRGRGAGRSRRRRARTCASWPRCCARWRTAAARRRSPSRCTPTRWRSRPGAGRTGRWRRSSRCCAGSRSERIILLSSGGSDWIGGSGSAEKVEGGYRITARKVFTSGAEAGDILMTGAVLDEDGARSVLHFGVPMKAAEVQVETPGARSACAAPDRTTW